MLKLRTILTGILPANKIEELIDNYEELKDTKLDALGIDSAMLMEFVYRTEEVYGIEIDFAAINDDDLATLSNIEALVTSLVAQKKPHD